MTTKSFMKRMALQALIVLAMLWAMPADAQNLDWAEPIASEPASSESGTPDVSVGDEAGVPGLPTDPTPVPIDGGLTLLGAAGAAYAVKRLRNRRHPH